MALPTSPVVFSAALCCLLCPTLALVSFLCSWNKHSTVLSHCLSICYKHEFLLPNLSSRHLSPSPPSGFRVFHLSGPSTLCCLCTPKTLLQTILILTVFVQYLIPLLGWKEQEPYLSCSLLYSRYLAQHMPQKRSSLYILGPHEVFKLFMINSFWLL